MSDKEIDKINGIHNFFGGGAVYQNLIKKSKDFLYDIESQSESDALDGKKITDDWFPLPFFEVNEKGRIVDGFSSTKYTVYPDIFISHSHKDEEKIKLFANYLYAKFGIKSFIDSIFWNYCDDLLRILDNKYNKGDGKYSGGYNYKGRNYTTSHVHMMLAEALTNVIDKTECFLFIESANSVPSIVEAIKNTQSPWIYHEINTVKSMRSRIPYRYALRSNLLLQESYNNNMLNFLKVNYPIYTNGYTKVTAHDFNKLSEIAEANSHKPEFYLDELYKDKKINIRTCSDEFYKYVPRNMLNGNLRKERERKELYEEAVTEACRDFEVCEELKPYFDATVRLNDDKVIPELLKYTYKKFADGELNTEECKRIFECLAYFNNEELYTACGLENERNDFSKRKENKLLGKKLEEHGLACLSESGNSLQLTQFGRKFFEIVRSDIIFLMGL